MRLIYAIVLAVGLAAIVADHLSSPSAGRACRRRILPAPVPLRRALSFRQAQVGIRSG